MLLHVQGNRIGTKDAKGSSRTGDNCGCSVAAASSAEQEPLALAVDWQEKVELAHGVAVELSPEDVFSTNSLVLCGPNGLFICPEVRAFTGFGARFLQPSPMSLVAVKQYYSNSRQWPLMGDTLVPKRPQLGPRN